MAELLWRIDVVRITGEPMKVEGVTGTLTPCEPVFEGYATTKALANEVADVYRKFNDKMLVVTVVYEGDE